MNVGELFQRLSYGELLGIAAGQDGVGTLSIGQQARAVSFANSALKELYSKFVHRRNFVDVELQEGIKRYKLTEEFSVSQALTFPDNPHYIVDSTLEPFEDDVLKMLSITHNEEDTVEGREIGERILHSIQWLSFNEFRVLEPEVGSVITIEYQAKHKPLSLPPVLSEKIYLAPLLEPALEVRVAAAFYSAMNGEANMVKSQQLLGQFEQLCGLVTQMDLLLETASWDNERLASRGWL